jgi:hypothetical protein
MRQPNNQINERQRYLDSNLDVNPFEDGNTPENTIQGFIYTSEINNTDYIDAYEGTVSFLKSEKGRTGNNDFYTIRVNYEIDNVVADGWFGSNLIKEGEPFIMINGTGAIDFNYFKGAIVNIVNIDYTIGVSTTTYRYDLLCALTEGDPNNLLPTGGQIFKTNRRVFTEKTKSCPVDLHASSENGTVRFEWTDESELAVSYRLYIRDKDNPMSGTTFLVNGNHVNFYGGIETQLSSGSATDWKITDSNYGCSFETFPVNFIASGNLPSVNLHTDSCGSIEISEWEVLHIPTWNLNPNNYYMSLIVQPVGKKSWAGLDYLIFPQALWFEFESLDIKGYVRNSTALVRQDTYQIEIYPNRLISEWDNLTGEERLERIIHQKLKIHTGIEVLSTGSNMTKPPKISYDKYSTNTKFVLSGIGGNFYWSVASVFDCEQKTYSEWSPEELLIVK